MRCPQTLKQQLYTRCLNNHSTHRALLTSLSRGLFEPTCLILKRFIGHTHRPTKWRRTRLSARPILAHDKTKHVGQGRQRRVRQLIRQVQEKQKTLDEENDAEQDKASEAIEVEKQGNPPILNLASADGGGADSSINIVSLLSLPDADPIDQLLLVVGRYLPRATPHITIEQSRDDDLNEEEATPQAIQIVAVNDEYDIRVSRDVTMTNDLVQSIDTIFKAVGEEYCQHLVEELKARNSQDKEAKLFPMHKLRAMLELDSVSADHRPAHHSEIRAKALGLHQVQIYSGYETLGQMQTWPNAGIAERLARASADADILQRAEQAGVNLQTLNYENKYQSTSTKKKSYQLPQVQARNSPRIYNASMSGMAMSIMLDTMRSLRKFGLPDSVELQPLERSTVATPLRNRNMDTMDAISRKLQTYQSQVDSHEPISDIKKQQNLLPIREPQTVSQICQLIETNDIVILVSETGSGKTTQLPQILLEHAMRLGQGANCNIICTQPRRIAAISVANRVAYERNTYVGGFVGYQVRFDSKLPKNLGSIQYVTAGVLMKRLQDESQEVFQRTSHIIIDEVHERDLTVDILMAFLRDLLRKRKPSNQSFPKLILMSATMKSTDFEQYFAARDGLFVPHVASIAIPGRTYPVTTYTLDDIVPTLATTYARQNQIMDLLKESKEYLEIEDSLAEENEQESDDIQEPGFKSVPRDPILDALIPYGLITATVAHILRTYERGDILIFLPGMGEIDKVTAFLASRLPVHLNVNDTDKVRMFRLHASLHATNAEVFKEVPEGCRRIILATNIAQTSITLPDVVHVIDTGKRREMVYDQISRRNSFDAVWIDQATSFQRRGRAGRVQKGYYWAMFTEARFKAMSENASPELLVSDLTSSSLILKSHSDTIDLHHFFEETLDAPDTEIVDACIKGLQRLRMLTHDERITPLGQFCSEFPLHPAQARGLLLGVLFGCFRPMLLIACHDQSSPLLHSALARKEAYHASLDFAGVSDDDRRVFVKAFTKYDTAVQNEAFDELAELQAKHVRPDTYENMLNIGRQLYEIMAKYDFFLDDSVRNLRDKDMNVFRHLDKFSNTYEHDVNLFKALALTVMDGNLAVWDGEEASWIAKDIKCILRPYSVNTKQSLSTMRRGAFRQTGEVVGFSELLRNVVSSPRPYLVETSSITPLMAMLFGGPLRVLDQHTVEIDGWLRYKIDVTDGDGDGDARKTTNHSRAEYESPALIIAEFRKAVDRFTSLAFSDLKKLPSRSALWERQIGFVLRERFSNKLFWRFNLRNTMRKQLVKLLEADAEHWDNVLQVT